MNYSLSLLGNGAAILLMVIGLINFVNVMLTGVVARKNEFAIMESIGTTKKPIMKILTLEGGIYALISTCLLYTSYDDEPDFETIWSSIFDLSNLMI